LMRMVEKPVFYFRGTADYELAEIKISEPVQRDAQEWTAHLQMTGPFREDSDVHGATKKQAIALALGLCHLHVGTRRLVDRSGALVCVPGKPLPKPRDVDDGVRSEHGLCVCLVDEGNGKVRLVLDEVTRAGSAWTTKMFYTHKRYPKKSVVNHSLTEKQLAEIGEAVLVRLAAGAPLQGPRR
jgi:hypothetical protein